MAVVEQLERARVAPLHELHDLLVGQIPDVGLPLWRFLTREGPKRMIRERAKCEQYVQPNSFDRRFLMEERSPAQVYALVIG